MAEQEIEFGSEVEVLTQRREDSKPTRRRFVVLQTEPVGLPNLSEILSKPKNALAGPGGIPEISIISIGRTWTDEEIINGLLSGTYMQSLVEEQRRALIAETVIYGRFNSTRRPLSR